MGLSFIIAYVEFIQCGIELQAEKSPPVVMKFKFVLLIFNFSVGFIIVGDYSILYLVLNKLKLKVLFFLLNS